ncbi:MAG: Csp1 family four helix bundle copper storage protein [Mariprofundales bacterium]|nr:Csp1 family four helix bundle copper storage protein [Mariprofundales bacterium]
MQSSDSHISTQRRNMLKGAGAVGAGILAAATTGSLVASAKEHAASAATAGMHHDIRKNSAMVDAMYACIKTSEDCIAHCIDLIERGDKTLIDCLRSAQETAAFCTAHAQLAAANSQFLDSMCKLSIEICGQCQKECEKQKQHTVCKACADSCKECVKLCKQHIKA